MTPAEIVQRYYDEVWRGGNVDAIDDLLWPDHVDETPPFGFDGTITAQKQIAAMMRDTCKDKTIDLIEMVVDGNRVMVAWRMSWTQVGDLWGMVPADGRELAMDGMDFFEVRGDRIARTRHIENWLSVLIALGAFGA